MRTALWLLAALALAATFATFVPQEPVVPATVAAWRAGTAGPGPTATWLLDAAGMFDVVGSWWWTGLLGLLLVSLTGCLTMRVRVLVLAARRPPDLLRHTGLREHAVVHAAAPQAALDDAARWLVRRRFRVVRTGDVVAAERGRWREVGSIAFHLSLYLLLAGAVVGQTRGFTAQLDLAEGRSFSETPLSYDVLDTGRWFDVADHRGFLVTLLDFALDTHPDGTAADYVATVAIEPGGDGRSGGARREEQVRINHPVRQDGVVLHLVRYGVAPRLVVRDGDGREVFRDAVRLRGAGGGAWAGAAKVRLGEPGERSQLALDVAVLPSLGQDAPDVVDPRAGRSAALPVDPLVVVDLYAGDLGLEAPRPLSQARPGWGPDQVVGRARLRAGGPAVALGPGHTVELTGVASWAGLQVRRAPGLGLLAAGGLLMLAGLAVSSHAYRRRVVVRSEDGAVVVAGRSWQRPDRAAVERDALVATLVARHGASVAPAATGAGRSPS